jgi:hypothetical protein
MDMYSIPSLHDEIKNKWIIFDIFGIVQEQKLYLLLMFMKVEI